MFLRSGLDTTPEITRVMRERENAERAIRRQEYLARQAANKAESPCAKAHATMAAKKAKQLEAIEKRKATIAAKKDEAIKQEIADAPFNEFGRKYYGGLREAYNVAGAEMVEWFYVFNSLGCDHNRFMDHLRRDKLTNWDRLIQFYWS
jgi:hypothetical protein